MLNIPDNPKQMVNWYDKTFPVAGKKPQNKLSETAAKYVQDLFLDAFAKKCTKQPEFLPHLFRFQLRQGSMVDQTYSDIRDQSIAIPIDLAHDVWKNFALLKLLPQDLRLACGMKTNRLLFAAVSPTYGQKCCSFNGDKDVIKGGKNLVEIIKTYVETGILDDQIDFETQPLLEAIKLYEIQGLTELVDERVAKHITDSNVFDLLDLASHFPLPECVNAGIRCAAQKKNNRKDYHLDYRPLSGWHRLLICEPDDKEKCDILSRHVAHLIILTEKQMEWAGQYPSVKWLEFLSRRDYSTSLVDHFPNVKILTLGGSPRDWQPDFVAMVNKFMRKSANTLRLDSYGKRHPSSLYFSSAMTFITPVDDEKPTSYGFRSCDQRLHGREFLIHPSGAGVTDIDYDTKTPFKISEDTLRVVLAGSHVIKTLQLGSISDEMIRYLAELERNMGHLIIKLQTKEGIKPQSLDSLVKNVKEVWVAGKRQ